MNQADGHRVVVVGPSDGGALRPQHARGVAGGKKERDDATGKSVRTKPARLAVLREVAVR